MGKSVAVNLIRSCEKNTMQCHLVKGGKAERQAWGNLPVPPLLSACTWNMKVLFPKD